MALTNNNETYKRQRVVDDQIEDFPMNTDCTMSEIWDVWDIRKTVLDF